MKSPRSVFLSRIMLQVRHVREIKEQARDRKASYVSNAISCGVCDKIWTFSNGTSLETVAVGFSAAGRYFGPRPCSGAGEARPVCVLVAIFNFCLLSSAP